MKIVYSFKARQDLHDIYDYIAYELLVPSTAQNMTETIMSSVRTLSELPEKNPLYREEPWHSMGVRFLPVKNYMVFYTIHEETETVSNARIMYGSRDIARQLEETDW